MESETARLHCRSSSDSPIFTRKKQTNLKSTTLSRAIKELRSQGKPLSPKSEREENSHSEMSPHYSSLLNKACPQRFCFTRAELTGILPEPNWHGDGSCQLKSPLAFLPDLTWGWRHRLRNTWEVHRRFFPPDSKYVVCFPNHFSISPTSTGWPTSQFYQ